MQQLNNKVDGAGGAQGSLPATEWNQIPSELQNLITQTGQTLNASDLNQLGKALAAYVANGDFYTDGGVVNAYVLTKIGTKQSPPAYADGHSVWFIASNTNTGASTVNVTSLGVKDIKTQTGADLAAGEITSGEYVQLKYDTINGWFVLIPLITASQVASFETSRIVKVGASVSANALTVTLDPAVLDFRSSSLDSGTVVTSNISSTLTLTVSSGSTLGTTSGAPARLLILALYNGGVTALGIVNEKCGLNLDESGVVTTVAEGGAGGADSATTIYSASAIVDTPYRIVGWIDSTQTAAGTWDAAPSKVQGAGGASLFSLQPLNQMSRLFHVQDQKAAGSNGGSASAGDNTRGLNTIVSSLIQGASLSSNQITLNPGNYYIEASAPASKVDAHRLRLKNASTATNLILGTSEVSASGDGVASRSFLSGFFTLTSTSALEIVHNCQTGSATTGLGASSSDGLTNIYSDVKIWSLS